MRIGVISDTHGLVRPEALRALAGCERILHAGDIGGPEVLAAIGEVAPVSAVRGNNDRESWAKKLPDIVQLSVNGVRIDVIHNVNDLEIDPAADDFCAVISGHSHKPGIINRCGVLFVNPGSAGPRRFKLPVTVARIQIVDKHLKATITDLVC